jgi:uncharacterized protein (TIGR03086 family)
MGTDTDSSTELADLHDGAAAATRKVLTSLRADQWSERVATSSTDVRTLVNHFVSETCWVAPLVDGESGQVVRSRFAGDVLGADPVGAYDAAVADASAAFHRSGAMVARCDVPSKAEPLSGAAFCRDRFVDLLVHGWEIASASGQDSTLDPGLAESARALIEPEIRKLRDAGIIKAALVVADDATAQTKLLAFFGYEG